MTRPPLVGIRGVKLPVTDLPSALQWYQRVFDAEVELEFPDESGTVRGVALTIPGLGDVRLGLRENPQVAQGIAGFDPILWAVPDRPEIEEWTTHLDTLEIEHSPVIEASLGWLVVFHDPDRIEHHLYTATNHGLQVSERPGYGRVPSPASG